MMKVSVTVCFAMQRKSFSEMECPIARSLEQLGEGWRLLILREIFLGVRRFHDLERRLSIPASTLTRRLNTLCEHGLLTPRAYAERPTRYEYTLTPKGEDSLPVLLAIGAWGNRWLTTAIVQINPHTGERCEPVLVDRHTGHELRAGQVALAAGPDAQRELREALASPRVLGARAQELGA